MGLTSTIRLAVAKPWRAGISNSTSRVRSPCEQGRVGCFRGRPRRVPGPPFLPEAEQGDALSGWVYMAEDGKEYKRLNPRRRGFIPWHLAWQDHRVSEATVEGSDTGRAGSVRGTEGAQCKEAVIQIPDGIV